MTERNVLVVDNGSSDLKIGFANDPSSLSKAKRSRQEEFYWFLHLFFFANQLLGDLSDAKEKLASISFRRPFDRGYLINWDLEKDIWDHCFNLVFAGKKIETSEMEILLTEPLFNPNSIKRTQAEVIFEDYQFASCGCFSAPFLSMFNYSSEVGESKSPGGRDGRSMIVIDSGYSFSHVVPYFDSQMINYGVKRVNIGGKALTNYLKEVISYRHWNVMEETHLINGIKEKLCFVSLNYLQDLQLCKSTTSIRREFVLPDYINDFTGYVKPLSISSSSNASITDSSSFNKEQLNNERIAIPELLFNPSDIGINQGGIADAFIQCLNSIPSDLQAPCLANIVVTGGCVLFQNFFQRLFQDIRKSVPQMLDVNITSPENPITYAWQGGLKLCNNQELRKKMFITKEKYEEYGANVIYLSN